MENICWFQESEQGMLERQFFFVQNWSDSRCNSWTWTNHIRGGHSGYNQIRMFELYQEHSSFVTDKGLNCYKVMPFGLKNEGVTYQRLVNQMFLEQIRKTMEVYVDDMIVNLRKARSYIANLETMFSILREYQIKLNLLKCTFVI